jgi:hypothetical protein
MSDLSRQRCFNHQSREAAARCLHCQRYFCRECATEHDERMVCSACLRKLSQADDVQRRVRPFLRLGQFTVALLALWLLFYLIGSALLAIPSEFHEGAIWQTEEQRNE